MTDPRLTTQYIAIHCTATPPSQANVGVDTIRQWHIERGWSDVGYHLIVKRTGLIETGRPLDAVGAHVKGFNGISVAIAMVGGVNEDFAPEDNFTPEQWEALHVAVTFLRKAYPAAEIRGHRDFPDVSKACPSFSVAEWCDKVGIKVNPYLET